VAVADAAITVVAAASRAYGTLVTLGDVAEAAVVATEAVVVVMATVVVVAAEAVAVVTLTVVVVAVVVAAVFPITQGAVMVGAGIAQLVLLFTRE
jgi:hypothetical protein